MIFLGKHQESIIKQDCINKFNVNHSKNLPHLKKIILSFRCKNFSIQKFAIAALALELISLKKGTITPARKSNVLLGVQKGHPAGCKVVLKKNKRYLFLTRIYTDIISEFKNYSGKVQNGTCASNLFFQVPGSDLVLKEFEKHYPLFSDIRKLDLTIQANVKNTKKLLFLAKSVKLL